MNHPGKIIVLNGTSSSGKTSIAKSIQSISEDVFLRCPLDSFWDMTPSDIAAGSDNFPNMKLAMAKSVKALAETGHNVVVDIIFSGAKTYHEFSSVLQGMDVTIVKVECPLDELNQREIDRKDRKIGLAASQIESVHKDVEYDLVVNTLLDSPSLCATKIINLALNLSQA